MEEDIPFPEHKTIPEDEMMMEERRKQVREELLKSMMDSRSIS